MFLCPYVLLFTALAAAKPHYGVSHYASYVLMSPALAAAKSRYGVSPYVS